MTMLPLNEAAFRRALDAPLTAADTDGYPDAAWGAIITYLHGEGTVAERVAIERRLASAPAFAAAVESIRALWQTPLAETGFDVEAGLRRLHTAAATRAACDPGATASQAPRPLARPATPAPEGARPFPRPRPAWRSAPRWVRAHWGALAAVLLMGVFGVHVLRRHIGPVYYYHGGASGVTATLPDSTQVVLAPGSYLGTARGFPRTTRAVYLYGSAHFIVAHDARHPFIVQTLGVGTRVLGTTFAVHADTTLEWQVRVEQGKVSLVVPGPGGEWRVLQTLTAGEAVHLPLAVAWMARAGHDLGRTGMSIRAAVPIEAALRRAVIRLGAAAAARAPTARGP